MADIKRMAGTRADEKRTGWFLSFRQQWDSVLPGCNWRDFTFINVSGEVSQFTQRAEFTVCILGLWVELTYVWSTAFVDEMMNRRDDSVWNFEPVPSFRDRETRDGGGE